MRFQAECAGGFRRLKRRRPRMKVSENRQGRDVSKFLQLNGHDKADLAGRHLVKRERQPRSRLPPSTALAVVRSGHFARAETDQWINRLSLWL